MSITRAETDCFLENDSESLHVLVSQFKRYTRSHGLVSRIRLTELL